VASLKARQRSQDKKRAGRPLGIRLKPEPGEPPPNGKAKGGEGSEASSGSADGGTAPKLQTQAALDQRSGQSAISPKSSFSAGTSFLGAQVSESGFVPPDSMGSVGPTQVLVSVNGRIKVFSKSGTLGGLNVSDSTFWSPVDAGSEPTDPGVEYDRLTGRWIVSAVNTVGSDNRVMLAVSSGSTITNSSSFTFFQFTQSTPPPATDNGLFADYPQLGVDANAVYVGVNQFSGSTFAHSTAFVIRKSSVLGAGPIVVTAFRDLTSGGQGPDSPQPALDMDPSVGAGYLVGPDNQLANRIDVLRITNPGATPSISSNLMVTVPATAAPLTVPVKGGHHNTDALDERLFEAMIGRAPNGSLSLWTAHNIRVNSSGVGSSVGDRDGARWYQLGTLSTTPSLVQSGTLFDSAALSPRFFWIPSIAMNGQGNASLNTSVGGSNEFAEIASSGHLDSDSIGITEPPDTIQTSSNSYNIGLSSGVLRWGDYSQTVVDPTDNMTFWTFQEYTNAKDSWGLRVIKLQPPPPATPTTANPNTVATGLSSVSVQITGTSVNGSGFFDPGPDPGGPGYTSHIGASVSGGVTVNSVTYTDPTHVTLHLNTTGVSTQGPKDVTITNPDGQSMTGSNILVVGADVTPPDPPTFSGTSPASPANNNSPKILGSAEGGSTVQLYTDSGCTVPVGSPDSAANFASPGIPVSVADDSITTFYATATDISDNPSACSTSSVTYEEDSTPPAEPTGLAVSPTPPANDNNPVVSGTADAGTTVKLYRAPTTSDCTPGNLVTSGSDAAFGSPGLTAPVADNTTTVFRATATDAAGNPSACSSSSVSYIEDSTPPPVPSSLAVTPASPANNNDPLVSGSAEAGSTVNLYEAATTSDCTSGNLVATDTAAAFASPGLGATVADNSTTVFRATATDAAGNTSACSTSVTYVEDSTPPAAPTGLASSPLSPANDLNPEISGTAEAGSTVNLYTDSGCTAGPAATGSAANFASPGLTVTVGSGTTTDFFATATDQAGNASACSTSSVHYVEDSTLPLAPTVTGSAPGSPANNNSPKVFGSAPASTTVKLYTNSSCGGIPPVPSGSDTVFASPGITASVPDNTITTFYATATGAGNPSACSTTSVTYVEDSTFPQVSVVGGPSGSTGDTTPTFTFSATDSFPPGDTLTYQCSIDTGTVSFGGCSGPGNSDTPASPLANGSHSFRVQVTDTAGNSTVATRSFSVDTTKPVPVPPETTITKGPKKKTSKRRPKFKFTASQAGSTFQCQLDRGQFAPCTSPFRPPSKLRAGKHVLRVQAINSAGVVDPAPAVRKFKVV
jgi:hypothetical protein